jgi:glyoxylase-like metal-dependent hydrolase (beta-lactamase superfamily II)
MSYDKRVIKLQDNIYAVRGIWLGGFSFFNTYSYILCSEKNNEILLIDTCGPGSGSMINHAVELMGRSMTDITGIAFTHWHKDHTGSLAEVVSMAGTPDKPVKVFIHKADAAILLSQKIKLLTMHPALRMKMPHGPGKLPRKGLFSLADFDPESGKNPLDAYDVEFVHTPGHTPGHTSYLYRRSMSLFSGCGLSLFGRNTVGIVPVFYDREKQVESATKLADMEFSYLYPAHLNIRRDEVKKESRVPFKGKIKSIDRITGTLPVFRYPKY